MSGERRAFICALAMSLALAAATAVPVQAQGATECGKTNEQGQMARGTLGLVGDQSSVNVTYKRSTSPRTFLFVYSVEGCRMPASLDCTAAKSKCCLSEVPSGCEGVITPAANQVVMASAVEITLTEQERCELERRAGKLTLAYRDVQRAKLVLYAADGMSNTEIAGRLEMCSKVVGQWRRRFAEHRLDGLEDQPRSGRPRRFPPAADRRGQGGRVRAARAGRAVVTPVGG